MSHVLLFLWALPALLYFLLILSFTIALLRKPKPNTYKATALPFVSVIVAMRNEANNIPKLLQYLQAQDYPCENYEVILADDFSEDSTLELAQRQRAENMRIIPCAPGDTTGKKAALARALAHAHGKILLFTDADCKMGSQWIRSMAKLFDTQTAMVAGPVFLQATPGNHFQELQALEFASLQGSTSGAIALGKAIMCNGANLAISKTEWKKVQNQLAGQHLDSGDDIFLMHALQKLSDKKIRFAWEQEAIVSTSACQSPGEFFSQRSRWAGKSTSYTNAFTLLSGAIVALFSISMIAAMVFLPWVAGGWKFLLGLFLAKCLTDLPLMIRTTSFFKIENLMWGYVPLQLIYPFYVAATLGLSFAGSLQWKQRKIA